MSYRVFWTPHAEAQFERTVRQSRNPSVMVAAARRIDAELATKPLDFGESRYESVRIGFVLPLAVHYEILEDVRTVIVYDVRFMRRKK